MAWAANESAIETPARTKRDARTIAIYRALRCDLGQTPGMIAKATRNARSTVADALRYLERGGLSEHRDGLWFMVNEGKDRPDARDVKREYAGLKRITVIHGRECRKSS